MTSIKVSLCFAILGLLINNSLSLPQDVHFGDSKSSDTVKKDPTGVKTRLGLVASVLGKHFLICTDKYENMIKQKCYIEFKLNLQILLGNHPTGDDLTTNSDFQESPKDRQSQNQFSGSSSSQNQNQDRHCCCVHVSSQCPNRNSQLIEGNNGGSFGGQPRNKEFDDGIAVRIVNDVSII